jgi:hypothetical protein
MLVRWLALLQVPRYTVFPSNLSWCVGVRTVRG